MEFQNKSGQYVPCRALLNSASQSHFITERCLQRFSLSGTKTHAKIQGISSVNTETYHSDSILLRFRHTDWHTTLNCTILSHITATTPSINLDKSTWKFPKDIKLADEKFDQPRDIFLLIGADLFSICFNRHKDTPWKFPCSSRDSSWLDTLWSNCSYHYTAPLHWPTAVITDRHPGKVGIVRMVTIRTPKKVFKRPIVNVFPLQRVNSEQ